MLTNRYTHSRTIFAQKFASKWMRKTNSLLRYSYFNEAFIAQQISRRSQRFQQKQCKSRRRNVWKKFQKESRRKARKNSMAVPHAHVFVCVCACAALENAFASAATKNILPKGDANVPEYRMTDWENDNLSVFLLCATRSSVAYSFKDPTEQLKPLLSGQKVSNRSNMVAMTGATITIFISANYDHWSILIHLNSLSLYRSSSIWWNSFY